jgi:endonuclease/exonuclease/phosphatase (EEP) superfamily protein YafD
MSAAQQTRRSRTAWDSTPRPARRGTTALVLPAALILPFGLLATALRLFPPTDGAPALAASFIAYGTLAYAICLLGFGLAVLLARRKRVLAVLAVVTAALLSLHLSWLAPLFVPDHRPATTPTFTLLSLNIRASLGSPADIVAQARRADVVVLLETSPSAVAALRAAGMEEEFPYRAGEDSRGSASAIFSRFPLTSPRPLPQTSFQMWQATAQVPQVGAVRIVAAHPCNPFCGPGYWPSEHELLQRVVGQDLDQPLVVAGDFNAVDDHLPMRQLNGIGLRSATDIVGAGWLPTYPANAVLPPLIPIDHIMLDQQLTATSITRIHVAGTDHLGLLATLAGTGRE